MENLETPSDRVEIARQGEIYKRGLRFLVCAPKMVAVELSSYKGFVP